MQESDPRFAHLERKVGVFLLGALLVLAATIVLVGVRQGAFTPKARISFLDDSGRDLVEGMEVMTRGFRIGKVERLRLTDEGKVAATLAIDRRNLRWIREDSRARVARALIGDNRIEISPGTPGARALAEGGTIVLERDPDLTEVAKKVMEEVKPVLYAIKSLIEYLDDPQGDVKRSLANVNRLTAGLVETRVEIDRAVRDVGGTAREVGDRLAAVAGRLDALAASLQTDVLPKVTALVAQGDRTLADAGGAVRSVDALVKEDLRGLVASLRTELLPQVRGLIERADGAVAGAGRGMGTIERELPALLGRVNAVLENIQAISGNLVPASREAGAVLEEGRAVLGESQALLERTRELWPFREGTRAPERTVDVDSYRGTKPAPGAGAPAVRDDR